MARQRNMDHTGKRLPYNALKSVTMAAKAALTTDIAFSYVCQEAGHNPHTVMRSLFNLPPEELSQIPGIFTLVNRIRWRSQRDPLLQRLASKYQGAPNNTAVGTPISGASLADELNKAQRQQQAKYDNEPINEALKQKFDEAKARRTALLSSTKHPQSEDAQRAAMFVPQPLEKVQPTVPPERDIVVIFGTPKQIAEVLSNRGFGQ